MARVESKQLHLTLVSRVVIGGHAAPADAEIGSAQPAKDRRRTVAHSGGGHAERPAKDSSETVAGEREHQSFGRATTRFRDCPSTDFRIAKSFAAGPRQFELDRAPKDIVPRRQVRER